MSKDYPSECVNVDTCDTAQCVDIVQFEHLVGGMRNQCITFEASQRAADMNIAQTGELTQSVLSHRKMKGVGVLRSPEPVTYRLARVFAPGQRPIRYRW